PEKFRSGLIARLGAYALDNPGKAIAYSEVFDDLVHLLQESFRKEQKKIIDKVGKNLVVYLAELKDQSTGVIGKEVRDQINGIVSTMGKKYGYSHDGAINALQYLIKMRYDTHQ